MKVQFLGTGDAFGNNGRFQSSVLIENGKSSVLIDCGTTTNVALHKNGVDLNTIRTIVLTHYHGDHFGGIPFFLLDAQWNSNREHPLTIVGPQGLEAKVREIMTIMYPGISIDSLKYQIHFYDYKPRDVVSINGIELEAFEVIHSKPSQPHGLRLSINDKLIGVSGDTGWTDTLIEIARDTDLFICECAAASSRSSHHVSFDVLKENLPRLSCKRIVLTHISDPTGIEPPPGVQIAEDGITIQT